MKLTRIHIKRNNEEYAISMKIPLSKAAGAQRAFSDAVDLLYIVNDAPTGITHSTVDMKQFRTICKVRGEEEESLMMIMLKALGPAKQLKITGGFKLDASGDVANTDKLYIFHKRN